MWTNIMFSLLFTKSMTDFVEWLREKKRSKERENKHVYLFRVLLSSNTKEITEN